MIRKSLRRQAHEEWLEERRTSPDLRFDTDLSRRPQKVLGGPEMVRRQLAAVLPDEPGAFGTRTHANR